MKFKKIKEVFTVGKKQIHHINDRTLKYQMAAQCMRQHQYFSLPGEFKSRLPQEIIFPNLDSGRVDEYYLTDGGGLLINFEEESGEINEKTLKKFSKYILFASFMYSGIVYLVVLCHIDPKKEFEFYEYAPSLFIKIHYIYISQDEIWEKYDNLINKVKHREKLTDIEALDLAFVSKFISKKFAPPVVESLARLYNDAIIQDNLLKIDVGVILGGMILKNITNTKKQKRLLGMINMRHIESEIEKLVYAEFGDQLDKKDEEIELLTKENDSMSEKIDSLNQQNLKYKNQISKLKEIGDIDSPEARKIINSLLLL